MIKIVKLLLVSRRSAMLHIAFLLLGFFAINGFALAGPSISSPGTATDTGSIASKTPTFYWSAVSGASRYGLYISKDPYGESNLVFLTNTVPSNLTSCTIPAGSLADGTKYRWGMTTFDSNGVEGAQGNVLYFTTPSNQSDLIINNLTVTPASGLNNSNVTVSFSVYNQGAGTSNAVTTHIRINTSNSSVTTSDALLTSINTPAIAAGGSYSVNQSLTIPSSCPTGSNYVLVIGDVNNTGNQSNYNNDYAHTLFTVTAPSNKADLIVNNLTVTPASGLNNSNITVSFSIYNQGAAASNAVTTNIRINTSNSSVTTSDALLTSINTPAIAAGGSYSVNQYLTMPASCPTGSNYVWVIGDVNNTGNQSNYNNDYAHILFTVTSPSNKADLIVNNLTVTPASGLNNSNSTVSFSIYNQGASASNAVTTHIRINTSNSAVTTSDALLTSINTPAIAAGGSYVVSQSLTIPSSCPTGSNYVWVIGDVSNTGNQSNYNNDYAHTLFTVTAPSNKADLIVNNLTVTPASGLNNSNSTVSFSIYNQGAAASNAVTTNIRINTSNSSVTTSDALLTSINTPAIAAGGSYMVNQSLTIPASCPTGSNYIWVIGDVNNTGNQSNYNNDYAHTLFAVTKSAQTIPQLTISPTSGAQGTVFTYVVTNMTPNGTVTKHVRNPSGTENTPAVMLSDANGRLTENYNSSTCYTYGTYYIWYIDNATGLSSNQAAQIINAPNNSLTPAITGITDQVVGSNAYKELTITGSGFTADTRITLYSNGGTYLIPVSRTNYFNSNLIEIWAVFTEQPAQWSATAKNSTSSESSPKSFSVISPVGRPVINYVYPPNGTTQGGYNLTISGQNFVQGAQVNVGTVTVSQVNVTFKDSFTLQVLMPMGTLGKTSISVTNPDTSSSSLNDAFEYVENNSSQGNKITTADSQTYLLSDIVIDLSGSGKLTFNSWKWIPPSTDSRLEIFNGDTYVRVSTSANIFNPEYETLVLIHGWEKGNKIDETGAIWPIYNLDDESMFTRQAAEALKNNKVKINILAYNWLGSASTGNGADHFGLVSPKTNNKGEHKLFADEVLQDNANLSRNIAQAIESLVQNGYKNKIHFYGHSLGSMLALLTCKQLLNDGYIQFVDHVTLADPPLSYSSQFLKWVGDNDAATYNIIDKTVIEYSIMADLVRDLKENHDVFVENIYSEFGLPLRDALNLNMIDWCDHGPNYLKYPVSSTGLIQNTLDILERTNYHHSVPNKWYFGDHSDSNLLPTHWENGTLAQPYLGAGLSKVISNLSSDIISERRKTWEISPYTDSSIIFYIHNKDIADPYPSNWIKSTLKESDVEYSAENAGGITWGDVAYFIQETQIFSPIISALLTPQQVGSSHTSSGSSTASLNISGWETSSGGNVIITSDGEATLTVSTQPAVLTAEVTLPADVIRLSIDLSQYNALKTDTFSVYFNNTLISQFNGSMFSSNVGEKTSMGPIDMRDFAGQTGNLTLVYNSVTPNRTIVLHDMSWAFGKTNYTISAPKTDLSEAVVFPSPFMPSKGHKSIKFGKLTANATVKIYTIAGELVRELSDDDGDGLITWDVKNRGGQNVASDVYLALIQGSGQKKILKFGIER